MMDKRLFLGLLALMLLAVSLVSVVLSMYMMSYSEITGGVVSNVGTVGFVQSGVAGISVMNENIVLGSGYFEEDCEEDYAVIGSDVLESSCWVNTSAVTLSPVYHRVENSGNAMVELTATTVLESAGEFFCERDCENEAAVYLKGLNGEDVQTV